MWSLVCLFMLVSFSLFSQSTISGKILDSKSNESLIGASVFVPNTTTGAATDFDGNFSLTVPEGTTQLTISYTGYETQTIDLNGQTTLEILLSEGSILEEVIVVGYSTVKREDATGSIQTLGSESFNEGAITSPQELVTGKFAGVVVTPGDGGPGSGASIRIRAGSSLNASNDPLIIVDGVPIDNGGVAGMRNALNVVNPNDIETFTVLKDASSTAIYGSRASNGVILITTKKGKLGKKFGVGYNGSFSSGSATRFVDVMSGDEFRTLVAGSDVAALGTPLLGTENTDWQSEIFGSAFGMDHNVNLTGSAGVLPYRVSLGYSDKEGILKGDQLTRTTIGLNLNPGFLDNTLQINLNVKGMFLDNNFANTGAIGSAVNFDPTQPVTVADQTYGGYFEWLQANGDPVTIAPRNPLGLLDGYSNSSDVTRYLGNFKVDYRMPFLKELRASLNLGFDRSSSDGKIDAPLTYAANAITGGLTGYYKQKKENDILEFLLNYNESFGENVDFSILGGYSWQRFFFENENESTNIAGTVDYAEYQKDLGELFLVSLFSEAKLVFNNKYIFKGSVRRDGSSRFSKDNRWGLFPSAAFAWKLSDEGALKDHKTLTNLKFRLSYGVTGQQEVGGYYPYIPKYTLGQSSASYQFGNEFVNTFRPEGYDSNIKWEETSTFNVGFDFGFIDDRVYGSVDYYTRKTTDLLNFIPVPAGSNLTNFINTNVGDLESNGIEFAINFVPLQTDKSALDVGVNFAFNKNEITRLTATDDPSYLGVFTGGIAGGVGNTIQIHSVGFPANSFFVYEQVYDDAGAPIEGLYSDRNGDGQITPDDRYRLENPAADLNIGVSLNYNYGAFTFSAGGRASLGNAIYNNVHSELAHNSRIYNTAGYLNNVHSAISDINFQNPKYFSDHFVEDASFFRMDHITVGYDFGNVFGDRGALNIGATVQNAFVVTKYEGVDPEQFNGIDNGFYPRPRTFVFSLGLNF